MSRDENGWFATRVGRLSTGVKMLLILGLGLFPLGLIAILASIESARDSRERRTEQTLARLEIKADSIDTLLSHSTATVRAASGAISLSPDNPAVCRGTLQRLARGEARRGRYALYGEDGALRCVTPGFVPPPFPRLAAQDAIAQISPDGEHLYYVLFGANGRIEGAVEFSRASLADLTLIPGTADNFDLELVQGERRMLLRNGYEPGPLVETVRGTKPIAQGRLQLRIALGAPPVNAIDALIVLMPVMMWIFAAIIGWIIVDRLLLRPLVRMQRAVAAYQPGDEHLDLPTLSTPAREISDLGRAFDQVTQTVARHEADLEAAVERQTKLVREVHHRVKNNLQVVASLLNLHARGAANEEVSAAYASIQRRVDALAVVHRNHYAELEENRGVALRSLISELGANLRGTAPASAANMTIRLDVEPYYVTQDVAVSVAFLITEIVEFAMFCGAKAVTISLDGENDTGATLRVESESLKGEVPCDEKLTERFDRIVTGLSRQLRSTLERDTDEGRYSVRISVLEKAER
jgi:two-component sensor histidine kinase